MLQNLLPNFPCYETVKRCEIFERNNDKVVHKTQLSWYIMYFELSTTCCKTRLMGGNYFVIYSRYPLFFIS